MRPTLLCLALLSTLSACSSGGTGGRAGSDGVKGDPTIVAKAQPSGQFIATKASALGEFGAVPASFKLPDLTCRDSLSYDTRLMVSDVFKSVESSAHRDLLSSSAETDIITAVDSTHTKQTVTFKNLLGPSSDPVTSIEMSCEVRDDKQNPIHCDFTMAGPPVPTSSDQPDTRETCSTDYDSGRLATNKGTVALGTFKLASGESVSAQRISVETSNVDFKCSIGEAKKLVGTGKVITDDIVTQDLVTRTASPCTPSTTVYRKVVYQLDDGTILYANVDETTQAPQR